MKIFPFIMARIAGLPFSLMEELKWENKFLLEEYFQLEDQIIKEKQTILSDLLEVINEVQDYPSKFYLKIIRRDIYNNRRIKIKSFEHKGGKQSEFKKVIQKVSGYKSLLEDFESRTKEIHQEYLIELNRSRKLLHQAEIPEVVQNGLLLASHSFFKRLESYRSTALSAFNKKVLQSEAKYLQYLSRIATKTSPFSSFTKLAACDLNGEFNYTSTSKVRLNNHLYQLFKDVLSNYTPFYRSLFLRLNPSLEIEAEHYRFLFNSRNIESVQRIEKSEIIDFVLNEFYSSSKQVTFKNIFQCLQNGVEAEADELNVYLLQLIEFGILEWHWPFSALDPDWLSKLIRLLNDSEPDKLLVDLINALETVQQMIKNYEEQEAQERLNIQNEAFKALEKISDKILKASSLSEDLKNINQEAFGQISTSRFNLKIEKIFYEDVSQNLDSEIKPEPIQAIIKELEQLTFNIQSLYYNHQKETFFQFYKKAFQNQRIKLIDFYEAYYKNKPEIVPQPDSILKEHQSFFNKLSKCISKIGEDQLHINLYNFPTSPVKGNVHKSWASFIQIFGKDKAYIESIIMGYGKMFGRFLHLFPADLTESIRQRNVRINTEDIWLENVDASVFNPNVHPPLLNKELQMSGSQNNLATQQLIPVSELEIGLNKSEKGLALFHKTSGEKVIIFDFGFEAPESRSTTFQLLNAFNYNLAGPEVLINMLDQKYLKTDENGIYQKFRITAGKHLILRRRSWGIPKSLLPIKSNNSSDAEYFLSLQSWRRRLNIPSKVFFTISSAEFESSKKVDRNSDDYKPQYLDFDSPLHIMVFAKAVKKVKAFLKIEEMLPIPKENEFASEFLIEWDRG